MSDDPTKDIGEKYQTKPTLETVIEMIAALGAQLNARFDAVDARLDGLEARVNTLESRVENVEILVDRMVSIVFETRADVREIKQGLKVTEPR